MYDSDLLKSAALDLGFTTVGVAEAGPSQSIAAYEAWLEAGYGGEMAYLAEHTPLKRHPEALLPGVRSVVAVSLNYNQTNPAREGAAHVARYALGRDYHRVLRGKLRKLAAWITEQHPNATCRACVDSAPILEREYANRAGLGWYGKNTCLIDSKRGSWFFIGLLLTTVEFRPDRPSLGGCGTCNACIDACPTGAIVLLGGRWSVDSRRCISYLTIEKRGSLSPEDAKAVGSWTYGCDVCQEVCPFNAPRATQPLRAAFTEEPDFAPRRFPSLREMAELSYEDWDLLTEGSALRRAGHEGLQRNAATNLTNIERGVSAPPHQAI